MQGLWSRMESVLRLQNWCESGAKLGALGAAKLVQKLGTLHQLLVQFAPAMLVHFAPDNWCNIAFDWCILHQITANSIQILTILPMNRSPQFTYEQIIYQNEQFCL
ncbi:hypothetical protein Adt_07002 [Abeliophyllum distichum]|uniref:Uncharacterized protein n=1 Tax=Abeliophyllum distichum TaxID=126358 RepID=A0ABD1V8J7_9LAMI